MAGRFHAPYTHMGRLEPLGGCYHPSEIMVQEDAGFLYRLPPELRQSIYKELFGNLEVHVVFFTAADQNPELFPTKRGVPGLKHCICQHTDTRGPHYHCPEEDIDSRWSCLHPSILYTCRQVFTEGYPVLYRSNRFIFEEPDDFLLFRRMNGYFSGFLTTKISLIVPMLQFGRIYEEILQVAQQQHKLDVEVLMVQSGTSVEELEKAFCQPLLCDHDDLNPERLTEGQEINITFFCRTKLSDGFIQHLESLDIPYHRIRYVEANKQ